MQAAKKRSLIAILSLALILVVVAGVTASLGCWQLDRARQKQALALQYEQGLAQPPLDLNAAFSPAAVPWQPLQVSGHWLPSVRVLLDNRALNGRPGYWVVGALALATPQGLTHVAVLRGWVERRFDGLPSWTTPTGLVQLEGRALSHIPRLYALGEDPPLDFTPVQAPVVQNVEIAQLEQATGLSFLPFAVQQTSSSQDGLLRSWEPPLFDINKHRGYALQWFIFAGFALSVLGVAVVRFIRSSRREPR